MFKSVIKNTIKFGSLIGYVLLIAVLIVQGLLPGEQSAKQSNAVGERVDDVLSVFSGNERVPVGGLSFDGFMLSGGTASPADEITVNDGETFDLLLSVTPANAANRSLDYTASGCVSVSPTGRVTALSPGSGKVKAASGENPALYKEIDVTVLPILPEDLSITPLPDFLYEGQSCILGAVFSPGNASYKEVVWSSSDPAIAEVDERGKVLAKCAGETQLTACFAQDSHISDSFTLSVIPLPPPVTPVESVNIIHNLSGEDPFETRVGESVDLAAEVLPSSAPQDVIYTVSNACARVNANGKVQFLKPGNVTVTAKSGAFADKKSEIHFVCRHLLDTDGITLSSSAVNITGGDNEFYASVPARTSVRITASPLESSLTTASVTYPKTTSDQSVATISGANVTCLSPGTVDIEYALFDGASRADSNKIVTAVLHLTVTENENFVPAASLSVEKYRFSDSDVYLDFTDEIEMKVGETIVPKIAILPLDASVRTVKIETDDENILKCTTTSVMALTAGGATVTVSLFDPWRTDGEEPLSFSFKVVVTEIPPASVELSAGEITIFSGDSVALSCHVLPDDTTSDKLTWSTDDRSVLTVSDSGVITAKTKGSATVTATSVYDPTLSASVIVTVVERTVPPTGITLNYTELNLKNGDSCVIKATFAPADATLTDVIWESDDASVATVSADGKVTANKKGVTEITAVSATDPTVKASVIVAVSEVVSEKITLSLSGMKAGADGGYTIKMNGSTKLSAKLDKTATVKEVTYSSSDERVAKVGPDGNLELIGAGTTTITAVTTDGEKTTWASLVLTVEKVRFSDKINDYFLKIRKAIGHFGAFFVLGLMGAVAYLFFSPKGVGARIAAFILCLSGGFAVAGITEICQLPVFTSGRYCSFSDVILDFNGYALSAVIVFAVYAIAVVIRKIINKRKAV